MYNDWKTTKEHVNWDRTETGSKNSWKVENPVDQDFVFGIDMLP